MLATLSQTPTNTVGSSTTNSINTFSNFYDQYSAPVYGYIKKVLVREDLANETLVTVFKHAWNTMSDLEGKQSVLCHILKIARTETNKERINIVLKQLFTCERRETLSI